MVRVRVRVRARVRVMGWKETGSGRMEGEEEMDEEN